MRRYAVRMEESGKSEGEEQGRRRAYLQIKRVRAACQLLLPRRRKVEEILEYLVRYTRFYPSVSRPPSVPDAFALNNYTGMRLVAELSYQFFRRASTLRSFEILRT